jgi:hypothetical protein
VHRAVEMNAPNSIRFLFSIFNSVSFCSMLRTKLHSWHHWFWPWQLSHFLFFSRRSVSMYVDGH